MREPRAAALAAVRRRLFPLCRPYLYTTSCCCCCCCWPQNERASNATTDLPLRAVTARCRMTAGAAALPAAAAVVTTGAAGMAHAGTIVAFNVARAKGAGAAAPALGAAAGCCAGAAAAEGLLARACRCWGCSRCHVQVLLRRLGRG